MDTLEPLDDLTETCVNWIKSIGSKSTKVSDIINNKDSLVYKEIDKGKQYNQLENGVEFVFILFEFKLGIKRVNEYSTSRASKVQKFAILPTDFSLFNGELGPTLKLRRLIVAQKYASYIDELYFDKNEN